MAVLEAYGTYLMHGGSKETFMDLTDDDIQIMYTAYFGGQRRMVHSLVDRIGKMFSGGQRNG